MREVTTDDASVDAPQIYTLFKRLTRTSIRSCVSFCSSDLFAKTHISVILAIAQNATEKMSLTDVAGRTGLSLGRVSRLIAHLVESAYVERHKDASDARITLIRLTARGEAVARHIADSVATVLTEFSLSERAAIGKFMRRAVHLARSENIARR